MEIISGQRKEEEKLRDGTWKKIAWTENAGGNGRIRTEGTSMGADWNKLGQKGSDFMWGSK